MKRFSLWLLFFAVLGIQSALAQSYRVKGNTGDKTKCERTKCEYEASVTANQRVTKHEQYERQKTKCAQNIHGANNSAYITTGGMGVFLTRAAFSVSHGCNGMNRGKNA